MIANQPPRVFLSYARKDSAICEAVRVKLQHAGLKVHWDARLSPGQAFTEQIQARIAHAHIFMPLITRHARGSVWVVQECGFALGRYVPCVPLCVGDVPRGMLGTTEAISVREDLTDLDEKLAACNFHELIRVKGQATITPAQLAEQAEDRSLAIQENADEAFASDGAGLVRIEGAFSCFALPDEEPGHRKWTAAYGTAARLPRHYEMTRREHRALKRHAVEAGLRLIVNIGIDLDRERGTGVIRTRLCCLLEFLKSDSLRDDSTQVVVMENDRSVVFVAVGDWFLAESKAPRPDVGVQHTAMIAHAPTVSRRIAEFDGRLDSLLRDQGIAPLDSKQRALDRIAARILELPRHPAWSCF
jgi:TIR domain